MNSFEPDLNYSYSDFDVRHQINVNWLAELPFGQGRRLGRRRRDGDQRDHRRLVGRRHRPLVERLPVQRDQLPLVLGDELEPAGQRGARAAGRAARDRDDDATRSAASRARSPIRTEALEAFRNLYPGEAGIRNLLRGDGYFTIDLSIGKGFKLPSTQRLEFRWDVFNLTNTAEVRHG